ncbi:MAG: hypothetical protein CSA35_04380 [Dethiosulfovibrio peptidovorans]|nr:MAG: hypothetical protein CSA35_04380 [Dethiosulfovibrio peptidovorans]
MKNIGEIWLYRNGEVSRLAEGDGSLFRRGKPFMLASYRTLSIRPFDYSFGSVSAIREALKIQYTSVVGSCDVEVYPVVIRREDRRFSGAALVIPSEERALVEDGVATYRASSIWPLPFALVAEIQGNGAVVCVEDDGIISALFLQGEPVLYRWQPLSRRTPEEEREWLLSYGAEVGGEALVSATIHVADEKDRLVRGVTETLAAFPVLGNYSLSRRGLDSTLVLEALSKAVRGFSLWLILAGLLLTGAGLIRTESERRELERMRVEAESIYRETFGPGTIRDPLSQAKGMLQRLSDRPEQPGLEDALRLLGRSWTISELGSLLTLDSLRYGSDGVELIGTAGEVSSVQAFQKSLKSESNYAIRLGDIQQIPGGGLRFSIEMRWSPQ